MKIGKQPLGFLLFVSLPQLLLSALLVLLILQKFDSGTAWLLAVSCAANVMFSVYLLVIPQNEKTTIRLNLIMTCVYGAMMVFVILLLEDSRLWGVISVRLVALLINAVSVVYALINIAKNTIPNIVMHMIGLVTVPLVWLFAINLLSGAEIDTAVMIMIVVGGIIMAYLIIKILLAKKQEKIELDHKPKRMVLYLLFSLIFPIVGLTLNLLTDNLFGDFSDPVFFIIPLINGILLILPPPTDRRLRLLRFFITAVSTTYLVYFFIVFLPFLPVGILGLIVILGALVLSPAAALVMQIIYLIQEWKKVAALWGAKRIVAVFIAGLIVLPTLVLTSFVGDRANLEKAIAYIEQDVSINGENVDLYRLDRAITNADAVEEEELFFDTIIEKNTPIISSLYAHIVLDNRIMANGRLENLRMLFFGEYPVRRLIDGLTTDIENTPVKLKDVKTQTKFDSNIGVYRTWVNLTMQGPEDGLNEEYVTEFALPEGAYISDYYLDVFGKKKTGILADQRAATWIYEEIVTVTPQQDPGLLHYTGDRTIELRVYPFNSDEPRYTGFEILHSEETKICIDGQDVLLPAAPQTKVMEMDQAVLIPGAVKDKLPKAQERPNRYYFVIDCSKNSDIDDQLSRIKEYAKNNGITEAAVVYTSYKIDVCDLPQASNYSITPQSGFNLALAVKYILSENGSESVPVILFTSDNPRLALFPENVAFLAAKYPESRYYYKINADETLTSYDFETGLSQPKMNAPIISQALLYNGIRIENDNHTQLLTKSDAGDLSDIQISGNEFEQAVMLDIAARGGAAHNVADSLKLLRASFKAGVLMPQTAFIVVETDAQESELLEKQQELIKEDKELIKGEVSAESLDEPSALICVIIAMLGMAMLKVRRLRKHKMD